MNADTNRTRTQRRSARTGPQRGRAHTRRPRRTATADALASSARAHTDPAARVAHTVDAHTRARRGAAQATRGERNRQLFAAAFAPNLVAVLGITVVAFAILLLSSAPLDWLGAAVSEAWMVFNMAPVAAGGITVSVIPMLPALLFLAMISWRINRAIKQRVSIRDLIVLTAMVVAIPVILTLIAWGVLHHADKTLEVAAPPLGRALARVVLFHLVALAVGFGVKLWRALFKRYGVPMAVYHCGAVALRVAGALVALAAVVALVALVVSWGRQQEMLAAYPHLGAAGGAGLIALAVLYFPNVVIACLSILVGSDAHTASASVSLFDIHLVPLPPMPWFAAIPPQAADWAVALLALTAVVCASVWLRLRPVGSRGHIIAVGSGVGVGLLVLIACYFAGGELGSYRSTGPNAWPAAGLAALWTAATGIAVVAALAVMERFGGSGKEAAAEPEDAAEGVDVIDADADLDAAPIEESAHHEEPAHEESVSEEAAEDEPADEEVDDTAETAAPTDTEDDGGDEEASASPVAEADDADVAEAEDEDAEDDDTDTAAGENLTVRKVSRPEE